MTIRYVKSFFNQLRQQHTLVGAGHSVASSIVKPKNYYFVDTNVIIGYRRKQFDVEIPDFTRFIEDEKNKFFYTESVLTELKQPGLSYPESSEDNNSPNRRFQFVRSGISLDHKEKTIDLLHDLWVKAFSSEKRAIEMGFGLSEEQLKKFKKDLFIIFEAGYSCYEKGLLPDDDLRAPPLLTNNMKLFNKFLLRAKAAEVLEHAINLSGLEHLIPVQLLSDTVEAWQVPRLESRKPTNP